MSWLQRFRYRARTLFLKRRQEREMAEEMREHLEERAERYRRSGLSPGEARDAARRDFGGIDQWKEQCRDERGWGWLERALKDLRLALRQLARSPGYTLLAVVAIALGVGANTSMFTAINTAMLKPLPYPDSARLDRIVRVTAANAEGGVSAADFRDLQREKERYGEVAAFTYGDASLAEPGRPAEIAPAIRVTANLFSTLGIEPQLGRGFRPGEDRPAGGRVLVISQRVWRNRFGGRADIIGRTVRVDGEPHEIVGVLPAAFSDWRHLGWVDLFRPLGLDQEKSADRQAAILQVIGRRSGRLSRAEAGGFIANLGSRLAADFPAVNAGSSWRTVPLNDTLPGRNAPALFAMLVGLAGFVLLIACSNLANLLLARTMTRAREFAVRSALGASRLQLLRPLIAESLLLTLAGGTGAVVVAVWVGRWFSLRSAGANGEPVVFAVDWRVLCWALAASLVTAVAFGLTPALFALRLNVNDTLKRGAGGMRGDRGHRRFRHALIAAQFALALVLLAGAAQFICGLDDLNNRRAGWTSDRLVTGTILLPAAAYAGTDSITAFHRLALERLEALPGVASASVSYRLPFFTWHDSGQVLVEGSPPPERGREPTAFINGVSPRYFETVGTRLLAGRAFGARDTAASPGVFIINLAMARGLFGGEDPIGRRLARAGGDPPQWGTIVGVVADVQAVLPQSTPVAYQLYQPMAQAPRAQVEIAVRTAGVAPAAVIEGIRAAITDLDSDLPVRQLQSAEAAIARVNTGLGVIRDLFASFAVLGLGLASLGVYGVVARTMAQRAGEFAIRLALGAGTGDIVGLVLASGVRLALVGSALGLLGGYGVSRLLAAVLPGTRLNSLPVLAGAPVLLVAVALVACYLPARHASRISPLQALRLE